MIMKNNSYKIKVILYLFFLISSIQLFSQTQSQCFDDGPNGPEEGRLMFRDRDADGIGGAEKACVFSYTNLKYFSNRTGDCNDRDPNIPGPVDWYIDKDNDDHGEMGSTPYRGCDPPIDGNNYVTNNDDCDDDNPNVYSGRFYFRDQDKDGLGDPDTSEGSYFCTNVAPEGYTTNNKDCDDTKEYIGILIWYKDQDGDGLGDPMLSIEQCEQPSMTTTTTTINYVANSDDACPNDFGTEANLGCPEGQDSVEYFNTVQTTSYDITERVLGSTKSYFDDLGREIQTQTYDTKEERKWASQTLYDSQGRAALASLQAPISDKNVPLIFKFKENFIKSSSNTNYTEQDFESGDILNPTPVGTEKHTLGWYYSTENTDEPYQDITDRPYSRTIFSELNPGAVKQTIGGNKINGQWKQGYSFSMPASQEMYYVFGYNYFPRNPRIQNRYPTIQNVINDTSKQIIWLKAGKTVVEDVHGNESVVFTDSDGKTLAAARSGGNGSQYEVLSLIGEQKFTDIHIPKGCENTATLLGSASNYRIYNLKTEELVNNLNSAGFYRVEYVGNNSLNEVDMLSYIDTTSGTIKPSTENNAKGVRYKVNYYDYSLNYYNDAGQLTSSVQPIGFNESCLTGFQPIVNHDANATSIYQYNSIGELLSTTSPDEGTANFRYRTDGQIRFSQNSKQQLAGEFSYTNYDALARPIESGVCSGTLPTNGDIASSFSGTRKEQHFTEYDYVSTPSDLTSLANLHSSYHNPTFLSGNVATTYNTDQNHNKISQTWYSYDNYGRVKWIVQNIEGLGVKTIDYVYDPITSQVKQVIYQKHIPEELFIHKYNYNVAQELVSVETSINGTNFTKHADYTYYETGAMKRTEIANGIQGIDYVYNLAGQLKAINHPDLTENKDPGLDDDDFFGMTLEYYNGDYLRNPANFSFTSDTEEQYNGNISALRWNTDPSLDQAPVQYSYKYDRNNWLTEAVFNGGGNLTGTVPEDVVLNTTLSSNQTVQASNSILLTPGFQVTASTGSTFVAQITANATGNGFAPDDYKVSGITYDANGNIQSLDRNMNTIGSNSNKMDKLRYTYRTDKPNQLDYVDDLVGNAGVQDIDAQSPNNYEYNAIGQLIKNKGEGVEYEYNASGLVTLVKHNGNKRVAFFYNDKNFRTRKASYDDNGNLTKTTDYIRDAVGSVLAIYENQALKELPIYGASRLGIYKKESNTSVYQLTDHLGNVRAVIESDGTNAAALVSSTDYYPFGMPMPNRQIVNGEPYRYAYQGQEKDPETGKEAFQLRLWDGRIGRWLTTDPYGQYASPYLGMGNNPTLMIDPDGGCAEPDEKCGWLKRAWYSITGRDYLVNRWDFVNDNPHIEWNSFTNIEEIGIAGASGSYLVNNSDGSTQEVGFTQYFLSMDLYKSLVESAVGTGEMVLDRFFPIIFIEQTLPNYDESQNIQQASILPLFGKWKPPRVNGKGSWFSGNAKKFWKNNKSLITKALSRGVITGKAARGNGWGVKYLQHGREVGKNVYHWEIKVGTHRVYGNIHQWKGRDVFKWNGYEKVSNK